MPESVDIGAYYDRLVERYGDDPRSCDYGRAESQAAKFAVLAGLTDYRHRRVLDVGCGLGDFAFYLIKRFPGVQYTGIDVSERMVRHARQRLPQADIRQVNIRDLGDESYDCIVANGIFYLLGNQAWQHMQDILQHAWQRCTRLLAFTSLSCWAPDQEGGEFYADPLATLAFCRTLSPWLSLRHDYHHRDFTIALYRERQEMARHAGDH